MESVAPGRATLVERAATRAARRAALGRHPLIVAAHPDDETIGAGALIARLGRAAVAHVTTGAPRDRRFFPAGLEVSRERYAEIRSEEAACALVLAGVPPTRVRALGLVDQELAFDLVGLALRLVELFVEVAPDVVLTHPYEGGHPDHDAVAFGARAAADLLAREGAPAPRLFEMTSYHGARGGFTPGRFLPRDGCPITSISLTRREQDQKRAMLACHASQAAVLAPFAVDVERFRPAPRYDFGRPPHEGPPLYERLGWSITGEGFRALARGARAALGLGEASCR